MRRPERALGYERVVLRQRAGDGVDFGDFYRLFARERRHDGRQGARQQRLAGAGRAAHQRVVSAGGGDFEGALGVFLPAHGGYVERGRRRLSDG